MTIAKNKKFLSIIGLSVLILVVLGISLFFITLKSVHYLSLDINPSIELEVNNKGKVVKINCLNEEAKNIMKDYKINIFDLEDVDDVVEDIIERLALNNYLSSEQENYILIASDDNTGSLLRITNDTVAKLCSENSLNVYLLNENISVNNDILKEAHSSNMSVGKYTYIKSLLSKDETLVKNDLNNLSVKELKYLSDNDSDELVLNTTDQIIENNGFYYIKGERYLKYDDIKDNIVQIKNDLYYKNFDKYYELDDILFINNEKYIEVEDDYHIYKNGILIEVDDDYNYITSNNINNKSQSSNSTTNNNPTNDISVTKDGNFYKIKGDRYVKYSEIKNNIIQIGDDFYYKIDNKYYELDDDTIYVNGEKYIEVDDNYTSFSTLSSNFNTNLNSGTSINYDDDDDKYDDDYDDDKYDD